MFSKMNISKLSGQQKAVVKGTCQLYLSSYNGNIWGIFTLCPIGLTRDSGVGNGPGDGLATKKGTQALISASWELGNQVTGFCVCGIKGH